MKTVTIKLYKFEELSETAQQKALERYYDININHEWWDWLLAKFESYGLRVSEFDTYRRSIDGELTDSLIFTCEQILSNYDGGEIWSVANHYKKEFDKLQKSLTGSERDIYETEDYEAMEHEFKKELLEDVLAMLQKEEDHLSSEEAIIDTLEANDYDFTEDGTIY